jgi:hypothetical protein
MASVSTRCKTGLAFLAAFEHLDVDAHLSLRSPTCAHIFAPSSYSHSAPFSNIDFATHLFKLKRVIERFPVTAKEIMEDEQQNRIIIWATGEPTFFEELKDDGLSKQEWVYKGEYVFILSMDKSGEKIERIVEFLDSKAATGARALVERARVNLE